MRFLIILFLPKDAVLKRLRFKESADIILIAVMEAVFTVKFPACQKEKERKKEMKLSEVSCALPTQQYKKAGKLCTVDQKGNGNHRHGKNM